MVETLERLILYSGEFMAHGGKITHGDRVAPSRDNLDPGWETMQMHGDTKLGILP
jgi:hypothetical protein